MKEPVSLWGISDELWTLVEPLIPKAGRDDGKIYHRKVGGGRPSILSRQIFGGIIYCLRTGCQWKAPPMYRFGSPSSVNKYFHKWMKAGFFQDLWEAGIAEHWEMEGIPWLWHIGDKAIVVGPKTTEQAEKKIPGEGKKLKKTKYPMGMGRAWRPSVVSRNKNIRGK
jgi:transposase